MEDPNLESNSDILILSQDDKKLPWKKSLNEYLGEEIITQRRVSLNDLKNLWSKDFECLPLLQSSNQ